MLVTTSSSARLSLKTTSGLDNPCAAPNALDELCRLSNLRPTIGARNGQRVVAHCWSIPLALAAGPHDHNCLIVGLGAHV